MQARGDRALDHRSATSTRRPARAVDPAGLVAVAGRAWSLDWWIGAEDRWHVPAREAAVRQALVGNSPVVETRVRVPERRRRAPRVRGPGTSTARRRSSSRCTTTRKVPFAVALAVRPYDLTGVGRSRRASQLDGPLVRVDGAPAVVLPALAGPGGPVGRRAATPRRSCSPATPSRCGRAEVRCADGLANAAFLFPLAHTATLRVAVPLVRARDAVVDPVEPARAPSRSRRAGRRTTRAGARIEVPNRGCARPSPPAPGSCSSAGPGRRPRPRSTSSGSATRRHARLLPDGHGRRRAARSPPSARTGR